MNENPYRVQYDVEMLPPHLGKQDHVGLFRQGVFLVVSKEAQFPDRCIKNNQPTTRRLRRVLYWHRPFVYLLLVAGPLVYVMVALFVRKKTELQIPLSEEAFTQRKAHRVGAILLLIVGGLAFGAGVTLINSKELDRFHFGGFLMLSAPIFWITASLWGILGCRMIAPVYIDDQISIVSGVCPEFLANLPEWTN